MKLFRQLLVAFALSLPMAVLAMDPVDLNTANAETLAETMDGVGIQKAQAIVAYREAHGPFVSVDDVTAVRGIGPSTLEKNRAKLVVKTAD
ncbi:MAG: helix-hairpin-helix domain-containing protein [Gammaproteobacteria bacterium]|nr:helix-hairpin-helix domain-containing protein [Gammaproteobacteria bacterium]MDJ0890229.1 helix-hairpin-helix domain-containing protein [Gammaproteobacteria bacterium]